MICFRPCLLLLPQLMCTQYCILLYPTTHWGGLFTKYQTQKYCLYAGWPFPPLQFCHRPFLLLLSWFNASPPPTGINQCPQNAHCKKWTEVYPTAKSMREQIWSKSYLYTELTKESGKCMQLWFTGTNPNKKVAEHYLNKGCGTHHNLFLVTFLLLSVTSLNGLFWIH